MPSPGAALGARRPLHARPAVEAALSLGLGLLLAVITRRPQDLAGTVPGDARDPVLVSWVLAWPAHAVTSANRLWDANAFAPLDNSLAFTDSLLGYLPFGLVGEGPGAALVRYNVLLLVAAALAFAGTWVLVRQLGLGRAAALVAATAFAFNPWRVSQLNHLQVLSSGGMPLALAMLARGHGVRLRTGSGPVRPGWALAGWATATWQISLGFGLGLQLAYLLGLLTAVAGVRAALRGVRHREWPDRRLLVADALGIVLFVGVSGLLAQPYFQVVEDHPQARRDLAEVSYFSTGPRALVTAPADSWLWGRYSENAREGVGGLNEKALLPGLTVVVLAAAGLLPGVWSRRRTVLLGGGVVVAAALALGTEGPLDGRLGYLLLYDHAPGWQGVRTPTRIVTTAWLGLALLAAHGVVVLRRLLARRDPLGDRPVALALAVGLSAVVLLEGLDTAGRTAVRPPPAAVDLRTLPQPILVLPSNDWFDQEVMRWSTDGFPRVVNGISGFAPREQAELREAAAQLPAPEALDRLRRSGVATLVLLPDAQRGTHHERVTAESLAGLPGVTVEPRGDAVVVHLGTRP